MFEMVVENVDLGHFDGDDAWEMFAQRTALSHCVLIDLVAES